MSNLLKLIRGGVAVFLSTTPKVFTWKDTKMWFFGSHEYGDQGRWRVSMPPRCRECALSLENILSDSGPNKPIHSLASAKLGFLKHRESLGQGQKVQTSYDSPPSAADRPFSDTAQVLHSWPSPAVQSSLLPPSFEPMKASFEVYCVLQLHRASPAASPAISLHSDSACLGWVKHFLGMSLAVFFSPAHDHTWWIAPSFPQNQKFEPIPHFPLWGNM